LRRERASGCSPPGTHVVESRVTTIAISCLSSVTVAASSRPFVCPARYIVVTNK
jgi:hypothetical protein